MLLKMDKRYGQGLTFGGSYVLSKLLTDADGYNPDNATALDRDRRLEKSIGEFDLTIKVRIYLRTALQAGERSF